MERNGEGNGERERERGAAFLREGFGAVAEGELKPFSFCSTGVFVGLGAEIFFPNLSLIT